MNISGTGWVSSPPASINADIWHHVAGVYDGSAVSLYLDGNLVGTPTPAVGNIELSNDELNIGRDTAWTERIFNGLIDESHIFNRALSSAEILEIYNAGNAGICQTALNRIFLPLTLHQKPSVSGKVTMNGSPAPGVSLELRFYNGSSWSTRASTTTDAEGKYDFTGVPALQSGQQYYVRYLNTSDDSRLYRWSTPPYTTTGSVPMIVYEPFDIADILLYPIFGEISLPTTFSWGGRPATPTDSYEFNLIEWKDGGPYYYTPPLGYVTSYTLTGLPSGFVNGVEYGWYVGIISPDGGYGESYYYMRITFR